MVAKHQSFWLQRCLYTLACVATYIILHTDKLWFIFSNNFTFSSSAALLTLAYIANIHLHTAFIPVLLSLTLFRTFTFSFPAALHTLLLFSLTHCPVYCCLVITDYTLFFYFYFSFSVAHTLAHVVL